MGKTGHHVIVLEPSDKDTEVVLVFEILLTKLPELAITSSYDKKRSLIDTLSIIAYDNGALKHEREKLLESFLDLGLGDVEAKRKRGLEELVDDLEKKQGVRFYLIPEGIYGGMRYTTPKALVESDATRYTWQHIHSLIRQGEIPAHHIGGGVILDAEGVRRVLERERASQGGRRPGQKTARRKPSGPA